MSNPRRTPVTRRPEAALSLKTNMVLRKGATFHSPTTPPYTPDIEATLFRPPSLPQRSQTSLDDVIDSHRRRTALTLGDIDKALSAPTATLPSSFSIETFRDDSIPIPRGILDHTLDSGIMSSEPEPIDRRAVRPRSRRPAHRHESDSGLGTSIATTNEKRTYPSLKKEKSAVKASAITRSAAARSATNLPALSARATNRIYEHTLKPLLAKPSLKDFHSLVLECPRKIQEKEIVCLRDVEKTLLLLAPGRTKVLGLYLDFCLTTVRCIQATVEYLSDQEQTRPRDLPYTGGYFIDLVDQIRRYAQQLADAKEKGDQSDNMDVDLTDEIKLHGGIHINGRPAELVRVKKNGKAISMATGEPIDVVEEDAKGPVRVKRSASQELEDEEEIMRSMARRKKNPTPEELAPKRCREPGCNKEFKRPCDLTKHEKTHSRPWKCPVTTCKYHEYGWPTEKEMDRHHNDKHSANPAMYECLFKPCTYKSKRDSNRKQHMEKAHGWTYVRSKTSKKPGPPSVQGSTAEPTPQLQNIPTPASEHSPGVATPPDDRFSPLFGSRNDNIEFPAYPGHDSDFDAIPQDLKLEYISAENGNTSADPGLDCNPPFHDIGDDFTLYEDIYGATARIPSPLLGLDIYQKEFPQPFAAYGDVEMCQNQHQVSHISPTGQGNAMLFTPSSLADVDEGFDEQQDVFASEKNINSGDFILFPHGDVSNSLATDSLFMGDVPSLVGGFSQPNSQDLLNSLNMMDWMSTNHRDFAQ